MAPYMHQVRYNRDLSGNTHLSHPAYRPDIDGLRAIAILAVVLYHAFPTLIPSGFKGVDIFFVISGFLISTIIFENLQKNRFNFIEFYIRRIKRIFPTLLLVLISCFVFGWFMLLPEEYSQLNKHIFGGTLFINNFFLKHESGYFDNGSQTKPLLHLWSLSVEEQFYLLWPFVAWLSWKKNLNLGIVTLVILMGSFALYLWSAYYSPTAAFYLPHARFWQLLCGGFLAWLSLNNPSGNRKLPPLFAWAITSDRFKKCETPRLKNNISLLSVMVLAYDLLMPGPMIILTTLATTALIATGRDSVVNSKILSNRVLVWFGLISYPLYLWHFPILSFLHITNGEPPAPWIRIAAISIAIFLAWLTYIFIEKPIRFKIQSRISVPLLLIGMIIVGAAGGYTHIHNGFPFRLKSFASNDTARFETIANAWTFGGYSTPTGAYTDATYQFFALGHGESNTVLFIGDSHNEQYKNAVAAALHHIDDTHVKIMFAEHPNLPLSIEPEILSDPSIKTVVLSYFWSLRYGSPTVNRSVRCCGNGKNNTVGVDTSHPILTTAQMDEVDQDLIQAIHQLKSAGKKVYLILDNPFGEELSPQSMLTRNIWGHFTVEPLRSLNRHAALERTEPARSRVIRIAKTTGAILIDPFASLCTPNTCPAFSTDGKLLYKDYDHLSLETLVNHANYITPIIHP